MPLDIQAAAEHPDVTSLKETVKEVAQRYAKRHNLCSVVDQALTEAGILGTEKVTVRITFTVSGSDEQTAIQTWPVVDLAGKTTQEQNAWVAEQIAPKVNVAGTEVTLPVTVIDLNQEGEILTSGGSTRGATPVVLPAGRTGFFTSNNGRVTHVLNEWTQNRLNVHLERVRGATQVERDRVTDDWLRSSNVTAECSVAAYYSATLTSTRSEDRLCRTCETSIRN